MSLKNNKEISSFQSNTEITPITKKLFLARVDIFQKRYYEKRQELLNKNISIEQVNDELSIFRNNFFPIIFLSTQKETILCDRTNLDLQTKIIDEYMKVFNLEVQKAIEMSYDDNELLLKKLDDMQHFIEEKLVPDDIISMEINNGIMTIQAVSLITKLNLVLAKYSYSKSSN